LSLTSRPALASQRAVRVGRSRNSGQLERLC
jgi:hypothetical protein